MPAPTLVQLAKRGCIKNLSAIVDVGDAPYEIVRDVLVKIRDPEQLRQVEISSPQICGEDSEVWLEIIKRNIPDWESKPHTPKNPQNWYKVYRKLHKDNEAAVLKDAEVLKAAMQGIKTERASHTSKLVDMNALPDNLRKHTKVGGSSRQPDKKPRPVMSLGGGTSKTKAFSGRQVIEKARREGREKGIFNDSRNPLNIPTHKLNARASAVTSVPKGLPTSGGPLLSPVMFAPKRTLPVAPGKGLAGSVALPQGTPLTLEERERRLKALATKSSSVAPSPTAGTKRDASGHPVSASGTASSPPPTSSQEASDAESCFPRKHHKVPRLKTQSPSQRKSTSPPDSKAGSPAPTPPTTVIRRQKKPTDIFMRKRWTKDSGRPRPATRDTASRLSL
ncbi:MAG: hypothetical protein M4579_000908 [Chaenotheca gracillima]|nr:MAG: hypothetical protein M4579_000908 [Chaenotheca gracillima]